MALGIGNGLLVRTLVGKVPPDIADAPILVGALLDRFYPVVGYTHGHPEIKTDPAGIQGGRKPRHTGNVFRNREGVGVHFMDKDVRKPKVGYRILVHSFVEIKGVVPEILPKPMVPVQH